MRTCKKWLETRHSNKPKNVYDIKTKLAQKQGKEMIGNKTALGNSR